MGKDGNCYFRCLAKWFKGDESHHLKFRSDIVARIRQNKESYECFLSGNSLEFHLQGMARSNGHTETYATELEIFATSDLYDIDVFVKALDSGSTRWNMYSLKNGQIDGDCNHERNFIAIQNESDHYKLVHCTRRPCNCEENVRQHPINNNTTAQVDIEGERSSAAQGTESTAPNSEKELGVRIEKFIRSMRELSHEASPFQQDRTVLNEHSKLCVPKMGDRGGSKFREPRNENRGKLISYTRVSDDRTTRGMLYGTRKEMEGRNSAV